MRSACGRKWVWAQSQFAKWLIDSDIIGFVWYFSHFRAIAFPPSGAARDRFVGCRAGLLAMTVRGGTAGSGNGRMVLGCTLSLRDRLIEYGLH